VVFPLYDDGKAPDLVAGDGVFGSVVGSFRPGHQDVVFYGVSKDQPLRIGRKVAASLEPLT
jgi:hypothetical protein